MFRSNQSNHIFTPQLKRFIEPRDYITFSAFLEGGGGYLCLILKGVVYLSEKVTQFLNSSVSVLNIADF